MQYFRAPEDHSPEDNNLFSDDGSYGPEWIGLSFTPTEDCFYGVTGTGLFFQRLSLKWCNPETVLADFLRYETSQGRKVVLFLRDEMNSDRFVVDALSSTPLPHVIRETDPAILVHSTSLEAGREILLDGEIKSRARLSQEGRTPE